MVWLGPVLRVFQGEVKVSVRAAVSFEVQSPLPGALVVGRIQFLVFIGMAFLFLAGSLFPQGSCGPSLGFCHVVLSMGSSQQGC